MKLMALAFASFSAFFAVAPFVAAAGDSVCQVKVKYTGTLPNPKFGLVGPDTVICEGQCSPVEQCKKRTAISASADGMDMAGQTGYIYCRCPSGGGSGKCRGQVNFKILSNGDYQITDLECIHDSACGDKTNGDPMSCSWFSFGSGGSNWLKCTCQ